MNKQLFFYFLFFPLLIFTNLSLGSLKNNVLGVDKYQPHSLARLSSLIRNLPYNGPDYAIPSTKMVEGKNGQIYLTELINKGREYEIEVKIISEATGKTTKTLAFKVADNKIIPAIMAGENEKVYFILPRKLMVLNEDTDKIEEAIDMPRQCHESEGGEFGPGLAEYNNDIYATCLYPYGSGMANFIFSFNNKTYLLNQFNYIDSYPYKIFNSKTEKNKLFILGATASETGVIAVLNKTTREIEATTPLAKFPIGYTVSDENKIYLTYNSAALGITVINEATLAIESTISLMPIIPIIPKPSKVFAITESHNRVYVLTDNQVVAITKFNDEYLYGVPLTTGIKYIGDIIIGKDIIGEEGRVYVASGDTLARLKPSYGLINRKVVLANEKDRFGELLQAKDGKVYAKVAGKDDFYIIKPAYVSGAGWYNRHDRKEYLFISNGEYYRYSYVEGIKAISKVNLKQDFNYPHATAPQWDMTEEQARSISGIYAAGYKLYFFFKNGTYSRFDSGRDKMDPGYPKDTALHWYMTKEQAKSISGIEQDLFYHKHKIYFFFKNGTYSQFDLSTDKMDPGYPKDTATQWNISSDKAKHITAIVSPYFGTGLAFSTFSSIFFFDNGHYSVRFKIDDEKWYRDFHYDDLDLYLWQIIKGI